MFGVRPLPVLLAILVSAVVFRWLDSAPKKRLKRSVLLFVPYTLGWVGLELLQGHYGRADWFRVSAIVVDLLELLLLVNLTALFVLDIGLRLIRVKVPDILHDLAVAAAYIVVLVWLMHRAEVNIAGIVATSAVVTAVIGLSLQSTLGNVIGGLALQVDDSIHEGDWIELDGKLQGQVKQVRWRHTVLETRDWDTLVVPNSSLLNQTIRVLGKRKGEPLQHRAQLLFNVDFRFSPTEVARIIGHALTSSPIDGVALEPAPHCICLDLARDGRDSFACYAARYWVTNLALDDVIASRVRERIYAALGRAEVPLAMPAFAVFTEADGEERRGQKEQRQIAAKRRMLRGVDLFAMLSDEELGGLAQRAKLVPFAPGEVIVVQGANAHFLYVLAKGEVRVSVVSADGAERTVAELAAPAFFGEMALMTGAAREANVTAIGEVECLRVEKADFQQILDERPALAQELSEALATRRVQLESARENLDAAAQSSRVANERVRILSHIQEFFGIRS